MLEAGIGDERRPRAFPLQQRVRRDGGAVREAFDALRAGSPRGGDHRLFLPRRGQDLRRGHASAVQDDRVRERPAYVDAENRHSRRLEAAQQDDATDLRESRRIAKRLVFRWLV